MDIQTLLVIATVLVAVFGVVPLIVASFLRNVEAGTIRLVSWLHGGTVLYRGPGKSKEIPLLTTGATISSNAINLLTHDQLFSAKTTPVRSLGAGGPSVAVTRAANTALEVVPSAESALAA